MNITENRNDNTLTLLIEGRIDTATAPKLEQVMQTALDGVTELFLDANADLMEIFEVTGFTEILTFA